MAYLGSQSINNILAIKFNFLIFCRNVPKFKKKMVVKGKFESNQSKGLFGGFSGKKLYFEESFHGNTGFLAFSKESFLSQ